AVATDTVVNTGAEGGPDAENGDTGQFVRGNAVRTTINENGRQIVAAEGTANTTVVYFRFVCQNGCVCGQSLGE
ncbi:hypothetical protein HEO15_026425, partial [Escherichia coli]|nr:hypothetical protein [Escherichia coli]